MSYKAANIKLPLPVSPFGVSLGGGGAVQSGHTRIRRLVSQNMIRALKSSVTFISTVRERLPKRDEGDTTPSLN